MAFDTKKIFDRVKGAANDVAGAVSDLGEKTGAPSASLGTSP